MIKIYLKYLFIFLFLVGTILFILPKFIDWNNHKTAITSWAERILGREVTIKGDLSLTVYPNLLLDAKDVRIGNIKEGTDISARTPEGYMGHIRKLSMEIDLKSFLTGKLKIKQIILENGELLYETLENGRTNWHFPITNEIKKRAANQKNSFNTDINKLTLKNFSIIIRSSNKTKDEKIENLNAQLIANNIIGPYNFDANLVYKDIFLDLGGTLQGLSPGSEFRITSKGKDGSFDLTLNGIISNPSGNIDKTDCGLYLNINNLNKFAKAIIKKDFFPESLNSPLKIFLSMSIFPYKTEFNDIIIKHGESEGIKEIDLTSGVGRLTLKNDIISIKNDNKEESLAVKNLSGDLTFRNINLNNLVKAIKEINKQKDTFIKIPKDLISNINIYIDRANYIDNSLSKIKSTLIINNSDIKLTEIEGITPGDGLIKGSGSLTSGDLGWYYDFNIEQFKINNLENFLLWTGIKNLPSSKYILKQGDFKFNLSGDTQDIKLTNIKGDFDKSKITGNFDLNLREDIPFINLNISLDNLDLDEYLNRKTTVSNQEEVEKEIISNNIFLQDFSKITSLINLKGELNIDSLLYGSIPFKQVKYKGEIKDKIAKIENLKIDNAGGCKISLKGIIDAKKQDITYKPIEYELESANLQPILTKLNIKAGFFEPKALIDINSKGILSGNINDFIIDSNLTINKIKNTFSGKFIKNNNNYEIKNGKISFETPEFISLINIFKGLNYSAAGSNLGASSMSGEISSSNNKIKISNSNLKIKDSTFTGDIEIDLTTRRPLLKSDIKYKNFNIYNFLPIKAGKDKILNLSFMNDFDALGKLSGDNLRYKNYELSTANINYNLKNGILEITELNGDYEKGKISALGRLNFKKELNFSGDFSMQNVLISKNILMDNASVNFDSGLLSFSGNLSGKGDTFDNLKNNFETSGTFNIINTNLTGISLNSLSNKLADKKDSLELENLISSVISKDTKTASESIKGKFSYNNNQFYLKETTSLGNFGSLTMNNRYDFYKKDLEEELIFNLATINKIPVFSVNIKTENGKKQNKYNLAALTKYFQKIEEEAKALKLAREKSLQTSLKTTVMDNLNKTKEIKSKISSTINDVTDIIAKYKNKEQDKGIVSFTSKLNDNLSTISGYYDDIEEINKKSFLTEDDASASTDLYYKGLEAQKYNDKIMEDGMVHLNIIKARIKIENFKSFIDNIDEKEKSIDNEIISGLKNLTLLDSNSLLPQEVSSKKEEAFNLINEIRQSSIELSSINRHLSRVMTTEEINNYSQQISLIQENITNNADKINNLENEIKDLINKTIKEITNKKLGLEKSKSSAKKTETKKEEKPLSDKKTQLLSKENPFEKPEETKQEQKAIEEDNIEQKISPKAYSKEFIPEDLEYYYEEIYADECPKDKECLYEDTFIDDDIEDIEGFIKDDLTNHEEGTIQRNFLTY